LALFTFIVHPSCSKTPPYSLASIRFCAGDFCNPYFRPNQQAAVSKLYLLNESRRRTPNQKLLCDGLSLSLIERLATQTQNTKYGIEELFRVPRNSQVAAYPGRKSISHDR
jgi:hypothetical protein